MKILYFFLFLRVIFALLDPDPDPETQINADPDPKPCFLFRISKFVSADVFGEDTNNTPPKISVVYPDPVSSGTFFDQVRSRSGIKDLFDKNLYIFFANFSSN
jgi:hypothetical protein